MCAERDISVIDISPLVCGAGDARSVVDAIGGACRDNGFFYVTGHGVSSSLQQRLDLLSREFFELDVETKLRIRMERGGVAWRGYFPVGNELTSGAPDQKEGLYFGSELSRDDPRVQAGLPLHGGNLFPDIPGFRATLLEYLASMKSLGFVLLDALAASLQLERSDVRAWFGDDPTILFRIFHYPPLAESQIEKEWSVGEHTDYGLLTILRQDEVGGLQMNSRGKWIDAPPIADSFVCNLGDMLDRMTGGYYRSTPHRVRNRSGRSRYSFPFFFDPSWDTKISSLTTPGAGRQTNHDRLRRWDGSRLDDLAGTYGDYLLSKVAKVFPQLSRDRLRSDKS